MFRKLAQKLKQIWRGRGFNGSSSIDKNYVPSSSSPGKIIDKNYNTFEQPSKLSSNPLPPRADAFRKREYVEEERYIRELEKEQAARQTRDN